MKLRSLWIGTAGALFLSVILLGQDNPLPMPVSPAPSGIDAFLDAGALAVARIDLKDIDLKGLVDWVLHAVEDLRKTHAENSRAKVDVNHELTQASQWVEKLRAAGAQHVFAVLDIYDITADRPPFLVIPLEGGADDKGIEAIFNDSGDSPASHPDAPVAQEIDHAVVVAVPATLERLKKLKPQPRPELWQAFDAAGKGQIHLATIPSEDARKTLEALATDLPDGVGGGPIETVSRGMKWICMSIDLPPSASMKHILQARDAAAAKKLKEIMDKAIAWVADLKEGPQEAMAFSSFVASLKPQAQGDTVLVESDEAETQLFAGAVASIFLLERTQARQIQAMSNLRQLDIAILAYARDHEGRLPHDLGKVLDPYLGKSVKRVWIDPIRPNQEQPYVYIKLAGSIADVRYPGECILLYENHTTWDNGVNAAFVDGHAELFSSEAEFKRYLGNTKRMNPGVVEMPQ